MSMPAAFKTRNEMHQLNILLAEHLDGGIVGDVVNNCELASMTTDILYE